MTVARLIGWISAVGLMALGFGAAVGQNYPSKPIRIVTSGVGGSPDFVSRLIAQGVSGPLGQQVIVDNRPSGVIPVQVVSQAQPDGYVLLTIGSSFWIGPLLRETPYDPVRDFSPITLAISSPNILVVHPSLPVESVKQLIALAKTRPGELSYSAGGTGGPSHLSGELFKAMAGVNMVLIPYKSGSQEMADLVGGHVQLTFGSAASVSPHIKSGRLMAVAVTSAQPSALFPGLPTIAASGLPGYEAELLIGLFAPAKTPAATINRLHQEIVRVLKGPEVKEKLFNAGVEAVGASPEEFAAKMKSEMVRLGKVIKDAGIRAD